MASRWNNWNSGKLVLWCVFTIVVEAVAFVVYRDDGIPLEVRYAINLGVGVFTLFALYVLVSAIRGMQRREYETPEDRDS